MPYGDLGSQLSNLVSKQMRGEGFGYSPDQRQQMWQQTQEDIGQQVQQGTASHLQNMQSRGILGSDVSAQGLSEIGRQQSQALARAGTQMDLQDQQMRQQGIQNAMGMGSQLAQMGQQQRQFDKNYGLQRDQFGYQQQQADRQYGLQRDQFGEQQRQFDMSQALQEQQLEMNPNHPEQKSSRFWSGLGGLAGTFAGSMAGPLGTAAGNRLGSWVGGLFE